MSNDQLDYRLLKIKNGKPFFAIINLEISLNDNQNEIIEEYIGRGWIRIGDIESVPTKDIKNTVDYDDWRKAVIKGIEFVFSKTTQKWTVKVKKVEGRIATDTNPTIIGYATILAFCKQTNLQLDFDLNNQIEDFAFKSWENDNYKKIPNFINLKYEI
ncbi:hypothetical protein [[Flexibacter] sp. ATCC 35103]|uniref:hypothetical protein n=1 Tax=[Flexibacter] sp. ATCC 35103 TaxID=1937528 RepID=UPI0009CCCD2C|nr:hypothetical protein [[Flexibacter] sp. ATCC 35103]OMQ11960.1 hypothetical protein BXU01_10645 [[Flexibacter] sp. ATCC 35103]